MIDIETEKTDYPHLEWVACFECEGSGRRYWRSAIGDPHDDDCEECNGNGVIQE